MLHQRKLWIVCRQGAWFGLKASLVIFGGVFLMIYGGSAAWWFFIRVTQGSVAAAMLIEEEGGIRALEREFWMAAGRVIWLTAVCTLFSAVIFAICAWLGESASEEPSGRHPLDAN